jgi:hypothetical protein
VNPKKAKKEIGLENTTHQKPKSGSGMHRKERYIQKKLLKK